MSGQPLSAGREAIPLSGHRRSTGCHQDDVSILEEHPPNRRVRRRTAADHSATPTADAAAAANHHPDIHIERYKTVRIVLTTHVSHGISQADIDLARTIDAIAAA